MSVEEIKNKLESERYELNLIIKSYEKEAEKILKEPISTSNEMIDLDDYKQELHLKKEAFEERLKKIEKALNKIKEGNYGFCEKCNQKIEEERLKIDLASTLCRQCALK